MLGLLRSLGAPNRNRGRRARIVFRRMWTTAVVLLMVSLCVFFATQVLPGDAAQAILGRDATPERLAALRDQLQLSGNPLVQYWRWLKSVLSLDLGISLSNGRSVSGLLEARISNSLILMGTAALMGVPLALLL